MKPLLFDTSIWVQFLRKLENEKTKLLRSYLENGFPVRICPIIYQEILQGCKSIVDLYKLEDLLGSLMKLELENYLLAVEAAKIHISLRNSG